MLIAPTSAAARGASFRPEIEIDGTTTRVLVEQTGTIDVSRLGDHHSHLTPEERWGVDLALETVLDLQEPMPGVACSPCSWRPPCDTTSTSTLSSNSRW